MQTTETKPHYCVKCGAYHRTPSVAQWHVLKPESTMELVGRAGDVLVERCVDGVCPYCCGAEDDAYQCGYRV